MYMNEAIAAELNFPPKTVLLEYIRQAFAAAENAVRAVDETQFMLEEQPQPITEGIWGPGGTVGDAILGHMVHDYRHFGMMEYLLGLQTGSGSASR
jgi:hypothetical protein